MAENILWLANFIILIAWLLAAKVPALQASRKWRHIIRVSLGIATTLLLILYNSFLGIGWKWIALLFAINSTPLLLSSLIGKSRPTYLSDEMDHWTAIASWFSHSGMLALIGFLLGHSIWWIGATILAVCGAVNLNFETVVKPAAAFLDRNTDSTYRTSGFPTPEELPVLLSMVLTALVYFPLISIFPQTVKIIGTLLKASWPIGLPSLFGIVTAFFAARLSLSPSAPGERAALARAYRGYLRLTLSLFALLLADTFVEPTGNSSEIIGRVLDEALRNSQTSNRHMFLAPWFVATVALAAGMVSYSLSITFLVMGGRDTT